MSKSLKVRLLYLVELDYLDENYQAAVVIKAGYIHTVYSVSGALVSYHFSCHPDLTEAKGEEISLVSVDRQTLLGDVENRLVNGMQIVRFLESDPDRGKNLDF